MGQRPVRAVALGCLNIVMLSACAGPMSPFGAINSWLSRSAMNTGEKAEAWDGLDTRVSFQPARQVLHGPATFSILIEDPERVPESYELKLTYNGIDITRKFMSQAELEFLDPDHRRLRLTFPHLRILASRENRVMAKYRRSPHTKPVIARYLPPQCSAFESSRQLASVPDFEVPGPVIEVINQNSRAHRLNPYYVAGLIAQESGFDPQAVSRARALGLTQVTPYGEAEVVKSFQDWPRYPGIDVMPVAMLRMYVVNGKINASNEWRLNPMLSIQGGVEYLSYISEYWSRPDKRALLERGFDDPEAALSEVMLASYNSGPKRVAAAVETLGTKYLQYEELGEARKYVRRVASYCDYFASRER